MISHFVAPTDVKHLEQQPSWILRKYFLRKYCFYSEIVYPCQILSKSDRWDQNAEPKYDLWADLWTFDPSSHLRFLVRYKKFLLFLDHSFL